MLQPEQSSGMFLESFLQDVQYGLRKLIKSPAFSLIAIFTLALGIGANTAIFSVVNALLLRPLPFEDSNQLMLVWQTNPKSSMDQSPTSFPNFTDWRERSKVFEEMGAWTSYLNTKFNLTDAAEPEQVQYAIASSSFFSVLKIKPALGRTFLPEEDQPGAARVVLISQNLWKRQFNSDIGIVGKTITLDGQNCNIVGVLPQDFKFVTFPKDADVWIPFGIDPMSSRKFVRSILYCGVIGRLKPGASLAQARSDMDIIARGLQNEYPEANAGLGIKVIPLQEQIVGNLRPALLIILGAVALVLLITCANVANLLLARATSRQREIALRVALGAGRIRIIRQLLTESLVLSVFGGAAGLLLALWGVKLLAFIPFNSSSPFTPYSLSQEEISLDGSVLAFTFLLSIMTGVVFGLAPALTASKVELFEILKEGGARAQGTSHHNRVRSLLVVAEIALSLVLLICAGLMIKSFQKLQKVDPGFDTSNVLTMEMSLSKFTYPQDSQTPAFYKQVLERIGALPGVESAGAVTSLPLTSADESSTFFIEGQPQEPSGQMPQTHHRTVTPDYLKAMRVPMVEGRQFNEQDNDTSPKVIIINQTMARRFWPGESAVGKRIALSNESYKGRDLDLTSGWREIVGVVGDVKHFGLESLPMSEVYLPYMQHPVRDMTLVLRTNSDPTLIAGAAREAIWGIDRKQPISNVRELKGLLENSMARPRSSVVLLSLFASVALVLAIVGVYGVLSYSVTQRTHEIGVRIALGAQAADVLKLVMKEGMALALIGITIGIVAAYAMTRVLSSLLFTVSATDPVTFIATSVILMIVSLLASLIPARKATRVDPMEALRYE